MAIWLSLGTSHLITRLSQVILPHLIRDLKSLHSSNSFIITLTTNFLVHLKEALKVDFSELKNLNLLERDLFFFSLECDIIYCMHYD